MGKDIHQSRFSKKDYDHFTKNLRSEMQQLVQIFLERQFEYQGPVLGYELEGCLVESNGLPAKIEPDFLTNLNDPRIVPELSHYNFEINSQPRKFGRSVLGQVFEELNLVWSQCQKLARKSKKDIIAVGILPTLESEMLTLQAMSQPSRYRALNQEILRLRQGEPIRLHISSEQDKLTLSRQDIMFEAATTSLQVHLEVDPDFALRAYNVSQVLAAPFVALTANSPFLFGKKLWDESRIPTFEQSISVAGYKDYRGNNIRRVTLGSGYVKNSLMELFLENLERYPILLPICYSSTEERLPHLMLHNGTIWRWIRPLIGWNQDGSPHLRLENRIASAGPSNVDMVANIAFLVGVVEFFSRTEPILEATISFEEVVKNLYRAARHGLHSKLIWSNGDEVSTRKILLDFLIPGAKKGLKKFGLKPSEISFYLDEVIQKRVTTGQNGATWQKKFVERYGENFQDLTERYIELQNSGSPVHEWKI